MRKIDRIRASIRGHITGREYRTEEDFAKRQNFKIVLDIHNDVHPENAAVMVARVIADRPDGPVYAMWFGNGGATVDPLGNVILNPPNTTGAADLYSPTYDEVVDDRDGAPAGNMEAYTHVAGTVVSDAIITCVIGKNQPTATAPFVFNEIGLKTEDDLLITHQTFTPVTKQVGNILEIVYTLVVTVNGDQPTGFPLSGLSATSSVGTFVVTT